MMPCVEMNRVPGRHGPAWRVAVVDGESIVSMWTFRDRREAVRVVRALKSMGCRASEAYKAIEEKRKYRLRR